MTTPDPLALAKEAERATDHWATPRWLLALISPTADHFDPCPIGGSGGLEAEWPTDRLVYVNPPFSNPLPWVRRAAGHVGPVTLLLPVDPTTKWWTYAETFEVILIGSRLHFNESTTYARQTLCIWRKPFPAAALRAAHEENQRLRKALGPCPKRRLWEEHKDSTNAELRLAAQMCTPQKPCARCIALAGGKGDL